MAGESAKRRTFRRALLVAIATWPIVHMGLVQTYGLSSWKLAGWGMYAVPPPFVNFTVRIRESEEGEWMAVDASQLSDAYGRPPRSLSARRWLGRLVSADQVAHSLLAVFPEAQAVRVGIATLSIDPSSGMVERERERGLASRAPADD